MKKYGLAVALLGLLLALPRSAFADASSCATVDQYTGVDVVVCYSVVDVDGAGSGTAYTLTVDSISGVSSASIFAIGWNTSATFSGAGPANETWSNKGGNPPFNIDGFDGNDWLHEAQRSGTPSNVGVGAQWTFAGDPGIDIVFHVAYNDNCSTWVASRPKPDPGVASGDCAGTQVPEPATLTLLGTGLIGIAGAVRRRMAKKA